MNIFEQSVEFWLIVAGAILFKLATSERLALLGVLATVTGSMLAAVVGTQVIVDLLDLNSQSATYAVACLLTLTGEDMMRRIILKSKQGESIGGIFRWLRDGEKKDDN